MSDECNRQSEPAGSEPAGSEPAGDDALSSELRSLTHDLRSSLTGIMGLTALIERSNDAASSRAWATRVLAACRIMEGRIATVNELAIKSSRPPKMGRWT